ncbi:MAG: radical SAM protein [Candidatus Sedimenticola sp. PURPLELP]
MEKILFIVPPHIGYHSFMNPAVGEHKDTISKYLPQGILSISAYLKKHSNVDVRLLDFNTFLSRGDQFEYDSYAELYNEVLNKQEFIDFSPDYIGLSILFSSAFNNSNEIAKLAKALFPESMIIAGGGVPTALSKDIYSETDCFDATCFGEGEKPLLALLQAEDKKALLMSHPSWITRDKTSSKFPVATEFIEDLDEIPFFDFSLANLDAYQINFTVSHFRGAKNTTTLPIHTSRGCPHHCCFCATHQAHGRTMRYHSITRVKRDLIRLKEEYGAKRILISDDNFTADHDRAKQLFEYMGKQGFEIHCQGGFTMHSLSREMLSTMKNAGLSSIYLPIESGSEKVLQKIMHKPLKLNIVDKVVDNCRLLGIDTVGFIVLGLPGETKADIQDSIDYLKSLKVNWYNITIATPLLGSELYDICKENGYFKGDPFTSDFRRPVINTEDFTPEYIERKAYEMNLLLNFVNNLDMRDGKYKEALNRFKSVSNACNDHAFAFYFMARCYQQLHDTENFLSAAGKYEKIISGSDFWKSYADKLELPPLENTSKSTELKVG